MKPQPTTLKLKQCVIDDDNALPIVTKLSEDTDSYKFYCLDPNEHPPEVFVGGYFAVVNAHMEQKDGVYFLLEKQPEQEGSEPEYVGLCALTYVKVITYNNGDVECHASVNPIPEDDEDDEEGEQKQEEQPKAETNPDRQVVSTKICFEATYSIHQDHRSKGYATQALRLLTDLVFSGEYKQFKLEIPEEFSDVHIDPNETPKIVAFIHPENTPSKHVAKRCDYYCEAPQMIYRGYPFEVWTVDRK
eukprot:UN10755